MNRIITATILTLSSFSALAEVVDKEPSLGTNFLVSIISLAVGLLLIRYRWWLFPLSLLILIGSHTPILLEIYDPLVGPFIQTELGNLYVLQPQIFAMVGAILILGYALFRRKRSTG